MMRDDKEAPISAAAQRKPGLSRRATRILVVVGAVVVLVLSYLSAVVLIEGAKNPDILPDALETPGSPEGAD